MNWRRLKPGAVAVMIAAIGGAGHAAVTPLDRAAVVRCFIAGNIIVGTTHDQRLHTFVAYWLGRMGGVIDEPLMKAEAAAMRDMTMDQIKTALRGCLPEFAAQADAMSRVKALIGELEP
jgi:hypothetical protein